MSESDGPSLQGQPLGGTRRTLVPPMKWQHFLLWVFRQLERYRISGPSMQPTLMTGSEILVDCRVSAIESIAVGDLVYLRHPIDSQTRMVKRVVAYDADTERYTVWGDNPTQSTDSRSFGAIGRQHVLGRVCCTFP